MSLSVNVPTLEERFAAQLEKMLAWAGTLTPDTNKLSVCVPGMVPNRWRGAGGKWMKEGLPPMVLDGPPSWLALPAWHSELFPDASPAPLAIIRSEAITVRRAIEEVREHAQEIAAAQAEEVAALVRLLVPEELQAAMLARDVLTERWRYLPPPERALQLHWMCFDSLRAYHAGLTKRGRLGVMIPVSGDPGDTISLDGLGASFIPFGGLPSEVALNDAIKWARPVLEKVEERGKAAVVEALEPRGFPVWPVFNLRDGEQSRDLMPYTLGLLYLAARRVDAGRRTSMIAVDAGKTHNWLLMGWTRAATDGEVELLESAGYVELLLPGQQQIALGLPGEAHEKLVSAIKQWRDGEGLRTYATLLHLLSIRGARQGFVRWTLEEHLDVQDVPRKERREDKLRAESERVELMTKMELVVKGSLHGKVRERRPLFIVGNRFEKLHGSKWELDGMELQANPLIWGGVRDDSGRLGTNYGLAPAELPRVNPRTHPAALALGLILPGRFRMALNSGKDFVDLGGSMVLGYAGLKFDRHKPGRAWGALAGDLNELKRIGGVRGWEWKDGAAPSLSGVLRFYMAEAVRERMTGQVRPVEPPAARPLSGAELLSWRSKQGLSQRKAAEALGVGETTVWRAERAPGEPLSAALRGALAQARDAAGE